MSSPTALISLRLTEEQILGLDQRVGTDGFRNRSDVVRESVRDSSQRSIIPRRAWRYKLALTYQDARAILRAEGEDVEAVFQAGARLYMQREMEIAKTLIGP